MTSMKMSPEKTKKLKLELFKSSIISAAYSLFSQRKREARGRGEKYLLQDMAERAGVDKSQASRWFGGGNAPNMQLSTLYAIGDALDGDVRIEIVDRKTGAVHTAHGVETRRATPAVTTFAYNRRLMLTRADLDPATIHDSGPSKYVTAALAMPTTLAVSPSRDFVIVENGGRHVA